MGHLGDGASKSEFLQGNSVFLSPERLGKSRGGHPKVTQVRTSLGTSQSGLIYFPSVN